MATTLPAVTHHYQNHHLDSTRWQHYQPRPDDIIVSTSIKAGTTWMQIIIQHLIFQDLLPRAVWEFSPWLESRPSPLDDRLALLEAQTHRRSIKSHLPLDGLIYYPQVKYVIVARDARDVFMSLWNHYSHYTTMQYARVNGGADRVGDPFPQCPTDIHEFWRGWITRGWFDWESEGYPYWSNMHHTQTWWDYRHLPNILMVHFNDLLLDLPGEIRRVADFIDIDLSPEMLGSIADLVSFSSMKENAEEILPNEDQSFIGGAQTFLNKGTNGRWRDVLTADDLKLYEAAVARELTPDCARWLENGRLSK